MMIVEAQCTFGAKKKYELETSKSCHGCELEYFYSMSRESAAQSRARRDKRENAIMAHHSFGEKQ